MAAPRARIGVLLVIATTGQVALGFATLAVTSGQVRIASSGATETLVATTPQTLGAVILPLAASLLCWAFRQVRCWDPLWRRAIELIRGQKNRRNLVGFVWPETESLLASQLIGETGVATRVLGRDEW